MPAAFILNLNLLTFENIVWIQLFKKILENAATPFKLRSRPLGDWDPQFGKPCFNALTGKAVENLIFNVKFLLHNKANAGPAMRPQI